MTHPATFFKCFSRTGTVHYARLPSLSKERVFSNELLCDWRAFCLYALNILPGVSFTGARYVNRLNEKAQI